MMKRACTIAWVGAKQMLQDPVYMMFFLAMPIMMTWLMGFLPKEAAGLASSGVLVMFVGLTLLSSAGTIIGERQQGTWGRLLATPASSWEIVAGFLIKLLAMGWIQSILLILAGKYLFSLAWTVRTADLIWVLGVYILAMTGLGLLLAGFLQNMQQVQMVSMGVVMVGTMLGGVFFPVNTHSAVMTAIARISPQGWAAQAINELLTRGSGAAAVAGPVLWLLGLAVVFLGIGIYRVRAEG